MVKTRLSLILAVLAVVSCKPEVSWKTVPMDGSLTGVRPVTGNDYTPFLGTLSDSCYISPSAKVFTVGATPAVAASLMKAQSSLSSLKEVIGHCPEGMLLKGESALLPRWTADVARLGVIVATGRDVDLCIYNRGGIRKDMPSGDVMLDDIVSMFPFRNYLCYTEIKGEDVLWNLNDGKLAKIVLSSNVKVENLPDRSLSVTIDGKPLDKNRWYSLASIDFLLDGGDGICTARNARKLIVTDVLCKHWFERYIRTLTAQGKEICYSK